LSGLSGSISLDWSTLLELVGFDGVMVVLWTGTKLIRCKLLQPP